jgi:hypothetical protein
MPLISGDLSMSGDNQENTFLELARILGDVIKNAPAAVIGKVLPVDKLIDTVARGIGLLYHPRHVKNSAAASVESLLKTTKAAELAKDMRQRAKFRRELEELHHQANLESIAAKAEKYLPPEVSPTPVDQGWTNAWADKAKNATRGDLQELWAKLLAGEVASPGSISTRTLAIVERMSARDAKRFVRVASATTSVGLVAGLEDLCIRPLGLFTADFVELVDRGLIHGEPQFYYYPSGTVLTYFDERWTLINTNGDRVRMPGVMLTDSGLELLRITDRAPFPGFASAVDVAIKRKDANSSIEVRSQQKPT